jgi:hypothetical protein
MSGSRGKKHPKRHAPRGRVVPLNPAGALEEEFDNVPGDSPETIWRRGLLFRAEEARQGALFEDSWAKFTIDQEVVDAAAQAAAAWAELAAFLRRLKRKAK